MRDQKIWVWVLVSLFASVLASSTRAQSFTSGSCQEESNGGSPNHFGVTAAEGDAIVVLASSYLGSGTVTDATWSNGTATITVDSQSATSGQVTVTGIKPGGFNGTFSITGYTATTISYALPSDPGTYISGGAIGGAIQSVTDDSPSGTNTYTRIVDPRGHSAAYAFRGVGGMDAFVAQNVKGGSYTVSVNYTPGDQFNATCALVMHGAPPTGQLVDVLANNKITHTTAFNTASINGNFTNEFFVAQSIVQGTGATTAPCGGNMFSEMPDGNGVGGDPGGTFTTGATTGPICAGLVQSSATPGAAQIISFLSTSSAPANPPSASATAPSLSPKRSPSRGWIELGISSKDSDLVPVK